LQLSIFKDSGGMVSGVCPALEAITPTIDALTADNCFDQDTFKNVSAQAVTVFDGCRSVSYSASSHIFLILFYQVIQQCNKASDAAALDLLPCVAGSMMTTMAPGGRNIRRHLVERLFNKH
jgi:hypothetical protein